MLLQFGRSGMEYDLLKESLKDVDKSDIGLFVDVCNKQKELKSLSYFTLKKEWKVLKTKQLNLA